MRQRNLKNLRPKNSQIEVTKEERDLKVRQRRLKEEEERKINRRLNKLARHDQEMKVLKSVVERAKKNKNGCTSCTKKSIRFLRQRIKDLRKELGMRLFGIPGREF